RIANMASWDWLILCGKGAGAHGCVRECFCTAQVQGLSIDDGGIVYGFGQESLFEVVMFREKCPLIRRLTNPKMSYWQSLLKRTNPRAQIKFDDEMKINGGISFFWLLQLSTHERSTQEDLEASTIDYK
nr:hypothetical protein [Tanacetum cinerariifolium]